MRRVCLGFKRREFLLQIGHGDLVDLFRRIQPFELVQPQIAYRYCGRQVLLRNLNGCIRNQNLPAVPNGHDTGGAIQYAAVVITIAQFGFSGVEPHPYFEGHFTPGIFL